MYWKSPAALAVAALLIASACATSQKVQVKQLSDSKMTCNEILAEDEKLTIAEADVDKKTGVTGKNVAAAVLFWPALGYTAYDAHQARKFINERRAWLLELYEQKDCAKK